MISKIDILAIFSLLFMLVMSSCAMQRHRQYIRDGLLVSGLNRNAFLKEWGMPDKTYTIPSDEFTSFTSGWGGSQYYHSGGATYFKGKVPLDVWEYKEKDITLVFHGYRLIAWKTEKTREEIKSLTP